MYSELILQMLDELTRKATTLFNAQKNNACHPGDDWTYGKEEMRILRCSERVFRHFVIRGSCIIQGL